MDFLISTANAQSLGGSGGGSWQSFLPLVALFVAFYFMLIRPQTKKAKEHRDMVSKLAVGDEVATAGGIIGRISDAGEIYLSLEVARDVTIKVQRFQVTQLLPKGTYKSA
jgi:preprotein translocase subunit YajC